MMTFFLLLLLAYLGIKAIKILSHNNISKDPILKAESRYSILIDGL